MDLLLTVFNIKVHALDHQAYPYRNARRFKMSELEQKLKQKEYGNNIIGEELNELD